MTKRPGWWIPKEHGAWVQLALPQAAALWLSGGGSVAARLWAMGLVMLFVAHEPTAIALGVRGTAARREYPHAKQLALLLVALGLGIVASGFLRVALAAWPSNVRSLLLALVPVSIGATVLGTLLWRRREKTALGEHAAAATFAWAAWPAASLCGLGLEVGAILSAFWMGAFSLQTAAARLVLARGKKAVRHPRRLLGAALLAIGSAALPSLWAAIGQPVLSWASVPPAVLCAFAALFPFGPRQLMILGISMLAADLLALWILLGA